MWCRHLHSIGAAHRGVKGGTLQGNVSGETWLGTGSLAKSAALCCVITCCSSVLLFACHRAVLCCGVLCCVRGGSAAFAICMAGGYKDDDMPLWCSTLSLPPCLYPPPRSYSSSPAPAPPTNPAAFVFPTCFAVLCCAVVCCGVLCCAVAGVAVRHLLSAWQVAIAFMMCDATVVRQFVLYLPPPVNPPFVKLLPAPPPPNAEVLWFAVTYCAALSSCCAVLRQGWQRGVCYLHGGRIQG